MDGTEIGVLKHTHKVGFSSLLESHDGLRLELEVLLEVQGNLPHKADEGGLFDEEVSGLLILPNIPKCHSARAVLVLLDHTLDSLGSHITELLGRLLGGMG